MSIRNLSLVSLVATSIALTGCITHIVDVAPVAATPLQFGTGEQPNVDRVYIVTDASGSTYRYGYSEAKALTRSVIAGLPEPDGAPYEVSWLAFGGKERVTSPLAPLDRDALAAQVAKTGPLGGSGGGTTVLYRVFEELATELEGKQGRTAILLITDGDVQHPLRAYGRAAKLVEGQDGNVCLHVVQVGKDYLGSVLNRELGKISPCGSGRMASSINTETDVAVLSREVFGLTQGGPLPNVAAPPPGMHD